MAEQSGPWDDSTFIERDWAELWAISAGTGVADPYLRDGGGNKLSLRVFSDGQGRQVKVGVGSAVIRGHLYRNTTEKAVAIGTNTSGANRFDLIVVRLDTVAKSITAEVRQGQAGSNQIPAAVQVQGGLWEMPLAHVLVPNNFTSIPAVNVTDQRVWMASAAETARWRTYIPSFAAGSGGGTYVSDSGVGRYLVVGNTCLVTWTSSGRITAGASNGFYVSLPMRPQIQAFGAGQLGGLPATAAVDAGNPRLYLARDNSQRRRTFSVGATLDPAGNGYVDVTQPFANFVTATVNASDPAVSYLKYPQVSALGVAGGAATRITLTGGGAGMGLSLTANYLMPDLLDVGNLGPNGFTVIYPITDGA